MILAITTQHILTSVGIFLVVWLMINFILLASFESYFVSHMISPIEYRIWVIVMLPLLTIFRAVDLWHWLCKVISRNYESFKHRFN